MTDQIDSETISLIQKQLEDLKTHPHVKQLESIKPLCYKIVYWPQDLDSLYSQMSYALKLTIPKNYPDKPPSLLFLDKIYHLNVHPNSGQIFISILRDDWSPFLNLNAIICSLDQILLEPDQQNAATTSILQQYQDNIDAYVDNVKATLMANLKVNPINNSRSDTEEQIIQEVIEVQDLNYDRQGNIQIKNQNVQKQNKPTVRSLSPQKRDPILIEPRQSSQSPRKNSNSKQKSVKIVESINEKKQGVEAESLFKGSNKIGNNEMSSIIRFEQVKKQCLNFVNQNFQGLKMTMINCKQLITIFSDQLQQLEKQLEKSKGSKKLKQLFEDRCKTLQEMLIQLFDISENINLKLMQSVRKDLKKYS